MTARVAARLFTDALWRPSAALATGVATAILSWAVLTGAEGCSQGTAPGSWGAFSCQTAGIWVFLLPAASGLIAAFYIAAPFQRGEDSVYRVRGMSLWRLRAARLLAGCAAGSVLLVAASLATIAISVVCLPWRREALIPVGMGISASGTEPEPGLYPGAWRMNPLVHDLLAVVPVVALAAVAMVAFGALIGYLTRNAVAAFLGSVLFVVIGQLVSLPGALERANPYQFLDIAPDGQLRWQYPNDSFLVVAGYWGCMLVLSLLAIVVVTYRQRQAG